MRRGAWTTIARRVGLLDGSDSAGRPVQIWPPKERIWTMSWNQLVGIIRENVATPRPHKHLVGVTAMNERTHRVLAWSVSDTRRGQNEGAAFYWGPPDTRPLVTVGHGPCALCGADVLQLEPRDIERRLPECRIGNQGRVLVGVPA